MKNTFLIVVLLLLGNFSVFSQTISSNSSTTRAVIIGISDYQEPLIPDLKYAHRDAEAFANWLRSPAGGSVAEDNILLHTNEAATNAEMIMSLDWLIDKSKPGDQAFIYFSGHGDVERVTKYNNGYLLGYDSPPAVYGAGAFAVNYLKDIIATLSDNEVQVFLISDACRAGKLAGSSANGTQVTASRLSQQFANEIKILSCQPDEFSIEGKQWGAGRGVFSYHLENALYGFADQNEDAQINLLELGRYLQDKVSAGADPESQIPIVQGPPKKRIAFVDDEVYAKKKNEVEEDKVDFLAVENRGFEDIVLAEADTNIQLIYQQFLAAIDSNFLLEPIGESANGYYEIIMANEELEKLHGTVKRKFVVALMDEGQQLINKFLQTDEQMMELAWTGQVDYAQISDYYKKAIEILGPKHYIYNNLKAKELYFLGLHHIYDNKDELPIAEIYDSTKTLFYTALEHDSTIAMIYSDLGFSYENNSKERNDYMNKSIELAPGWALGHRALADSYFSLARYDSAIHHYKKAIEIDSNYLHPYINLSNLYKAQIKNDSSAFWQNLAINKFKEKLRINPAQLTSMEYRNYGSILFEQKKYEEAKEMMEKAFEKSKEKDFSAIYYVGLINLELQEFENSIQAFKRSQELANLNWKAGISFMISNISIYFLNDYEEGLSGFDFQNYPYHFIKVNYFKKNLVEAKAIIDSVSYKPKHEEPFYVVGEVYKGLNYKVKANTHFQMILDSIPLSFIPLNTYLTPNYIYHAIAFNRLGNNKKYNEIIEQAKEQISDKSRLHFELVIIYANTNEHEKAVTHLYKAIEFGWEPNPLYWVRGTLCDPMLNPIRETEEFKALVKKHFPKYYDIATRVPGKTKD